MGAKTVINMVSILALGGWAFEPCATGRPSAGAAGGLLVERRTRSVIANRCNPLLARQYLRDTGAGRRLPSRRHHGIAASPEEASGS